MQIGSNFFSELFKTPLKSFQAQIDHMTSLFAKNEKKMFFIHFPVCQAVLEGFQAENKKKQLFGTF